MKTLTEQQTQGLMNDHQQWLRHPMTTQLIKAIDTYERTSINCLVRDLNPLNPITSYQHGCVIKATRDIKAIVMESDKFVTASTKE